MPSQAGRIAKIKGRNVLMFLVDGPAQFAHGIVGYVAVPLIAVGMPGFQPTTEDVRLVMADGRLAYAALWAFSPVLDEDIELPDVRLPVESARAVQEAYQDFLTDHAPRNPTVLGPKVSWWRRASVARFRRAYRAELSDVARRARTRVRCAPNLALTSFGSEFPSQVELRRLMVRYHGHSVQLEYPGDRVGVFSPADLQRFYYDTIQSYTKAFHTATVEGKYVYAGLGSPYEIPLYPAHMVVLQQLQETVELKTTGEFRAVAAQK